MKVAQNCKTADWLYPTCLHTRLVIYRGLDAGTKRVPALPSEGHFLECFSLVCPDLLQPSNKLSSTFPRQCHRSDYQNYQNCRSTALVHFHLINQEDHPLIHHLLSHTKICRWKWRNFHRTMILEALVWDSIHLHCLPLYKSIRTDIRRMLG